ncbi:MAG: hypothetical protein ACP5OA_02700 [Candidatus Woesearchaeota archaeon]
MVVDLLDIDSIESLIRKKNLESGIVDLTQYDIPSFSMPDTYKVKNIILPANDYDTTILKNIRKVLKIAELAGFDRQKLLSPLFEGCRNAHQHGNQCDPNKKILLGYDIIPKTSLDIVIIDEGGKLNPEFLPYLLRYRQGLNKARYLDFYTFCNIPRPKVNYGRGTSLIHSEYLDSVHYYKSDNCGLAVHLTKKKMIVKILYILFYIR